MGTAVKPSRAPLRLNRHWGGNATWRSTNADETLPPACSLRFPSARLGWARSFHSVPTHPGENI